MTHPEDRTASAGAAIELVVLGVGAGVLEADALQIAQQALERPRVQLSEAVIQAARDLERPWLIPSRQRIPAEWSAAQARWHPIASQALQALLTGEHPPVFWEGVAEAGRLLRPVNWAQQRASEWQVLYSLSQTEALPPSLRRVLIAYFGVSGAAEDWATIPIGVPLSLVAYGVMQQCRHAHARTLEATLPLLRSLARRLAEPALRAWVVEPLSALAGLIDARCAMSAQRASADMATQTVPLDDVQRLTLRALQEGVASLMWLAEQQAIEDMRVLGYALHNVPGSLVRPEAGHAIRLHEVTPLLAQQPALLAAVEALNARVAR